MKIMLCHRPEGAFGYITDGWQNALHDRGYEVRRWDGDASSWREYQPDLYIGCSGHKQPIPSNRNECQVAIHVNPCGPVNIDGINESQDNINWVVDQKPDLYLGMVTRTTACCGADGLVRSGLDGYRCHVRQIG